MSYISLVLRSRTLIYKNSSLSVLNVIGQRSRLSVIGISLNNIGSIDVNLKV